MSDPLPSVERRDNLRRLPRPYYQGSACVHWVLTLEHRATGWLDGGFLHRFRELLTHTLFRYEQACPIYCLMPDHTHLLWMGLTGRSDQLNAMRFLRTHLNRELESEGRRLQRQAFDHVLRDDETQERAFENLVEYIARNPERQRLVPVDGFRTYPFTGCLVPGYPELSPWQPDYWSRFWRVHRSLRASDLFRVHGPDVDTAGE